MDEPSARKICEWLVSAIVICEHDDYHRQANQGARDEATDLPESCFEGFHNSLW
jgi:hypothetical protein